MNSTVICPTLPGRCVRAAAAAAAKAAATAACPGACLHPDSKRRASDAPARAQGFAGLYAEFWRHARGQRHRVLLSSGLLVAAETLRLAVPWLTAQAIGEIQQAGDDVSHLQAAGWTVAAILVVMCLVWALHGPGRVIERGVALHVRRRVSDALYAKLTRLPLRWHEAHHSGDTLARIGKTSGALSSFAQEQFVYLQSTVRVVGPLAALWWLSPWCALAAAAGYATVAALVVRVDRTLMQFADIENAADQRYTASLVEFVGNTQSVLAMRLAGATRSLLGVRMDAVLQPIARSLALVECKWGAVDLLTTALTWAVVALYVFDSRDEAGGLLLGSAFMVMQYMTQSAGVVGSLAANFAQFVRYRVDYSSADEIVQAADAPGVHALVAPDWREIRIRDLRYAHEARASGSPEAPAAPGAGAGVGAPAVTGTIEVADLAVRRGEKIAVIGPSGAGKSTLMRVLAGLYEAGEARLSVDSAYRPGLRDLGRAATYVPQEAEVFEASVRDNLTFGARHDPARIDRAVATSAFDEVLATLPQGLDTPIIERGQNLSGGQRQRLALARGLLAAHGSSIVMLDEPTSALDSTTESRVLERIRRTMPEVTVIASIHRLSALAHFDRVVLMQAGRVVDAGTVDELAARSELFRRLQHGLSAVDGAADPAAQPMAA